MTPYKLTKGPWSAWKNGERTRSIVVRISGIVGEGADSRVIYDNLQFTEHHAGVGQYWITVGGVRSPDFKHDYEATNWAWDQAQAVQA